jgi:hypothetical protein
MRKGGNPCRGCCAPRRIKIGTRPLFRFLVVANSLASDLQPLDRYGCQANQIQPLDMFPQTYHIESVALLERPAGSPPARGWPRPRGRLLRNLHLPRLLKKVQMQGGARGEVPGVLSPYVAAPRERANAADGPFSAAC